MLTGDEWWRPMPTGASPDALLIAAAGQIPKGATAGGDPGLGRLTVANGTGTDA
jgi:hypothetical protein